MFLNQFTSYIFVIKRYVKLALEIFRLYWSYFPKLLFDSFRLITLVDYRLAKNGYAFFPQVINLELTSRCNMRCRMCWLWGDTGVGNTQTKHEMDFKTVKRIIDEIAPFKPVIYLQGGEVLVRSDAIEIMRYLRTKKIIFGFTTNGTLISPMIAKAIVKYATYISISIHGLKHTHDQLMGDGSFQKAMYGLKNLIVARGKKVLPIIKIGCLTPNLPYKEMEELYTWAKKNKVDYLQFGHLQFITSRKAEAHKKLLKKMFDIDCKRIDGYIRDDVNLNSDMLWQNLLKIKKASSGIPRVVYAPNLSSPKMVKNWYYGDANSMKECCFFPWFSAIIKSNGNVVPCGEYRHPEYVAGNIFTKDFKTIWNNHSMRNFRCILKKNRFLPGCDRCCGLASYAR